MSLHAQPSSIRHLYPQHFTSTRQTQHDTKWNRQTRTKKTVCKVVNAQNIVVEKQTSSLGCKMIKKWQKTIMTGTKYRTLNENAAPVRLSSSWCVLIIHGFQTCWWNTLLDRTYRDLFNFIAGAIPSRRWYIIDMLNKGDRCVDNNWEYDDTDPLLYGIKHVRWKVNK